MVSIVAHFLDNTKSKKSEIMQSNRGGILLCRFWLNGTKAVVDVAMTDADTTPYNNMTINKCLSKNDHYKKNKYLQVCLVQCIYLTLLVLVLVR